MEFFISIIIILFIIVIFISYLEKTIDKSLKNTPQAKAPYKPKTRKEKKAQGDEYEKYISEIYKGRGYQVWEHGLEKGFNDLGIDLIAYKKDTAILIQCKDWNNNGKWKISIKHIEKFENDAKRFLNKNPSFRRKNLYLKYIISGNFINKNTIGYINSKPNLNFQIVR